MKAEIIAIGSELLTPERIDTNSLYLTQKLTEAGFAVHLKTVVGDSVDDIENLLRAACRRSQCIVLCGGLGPTEDDCTRAAAAKALQRTISTDTEVLEALRLRFARRGVPMAKINERQAEVIAGAQILANPVGTAPGMWIEEEGTWLILLPGPPREMTAVFESQVLPRFAGLGGGRRLERRTLGIHGLTESEVDSRIAPVYRSYPGIQTTVLAAAGCISVWLQQWRSQDEGISDLEELFFRVQKVLGDFVFTTADEKLEEVVGRLLRASGQSLAIAESCTAGMIGAAISRVPGSSAYFHGGVICYSNDMKVDLCGVSRTLLAGHGAVSAAVAEALARGVRAVAHSSIGLSVTGIAGPGGGSEEKPVGLVYVGLADAMRCTHMRRIFPGDRQTVRELTTTAALGRLRRFLLPGETIT